MAYNRVTWSGTMPGGEVWSVGCAFMPNFGNALDTFGELDAWAAGIAAGFTGDVLPTNIRSLLSSAVAVNKVRTEYLDTNSNLIQAAEATFSPVQGTGSPTKPYQTSVVSSLLTGVPGRSNRGRMYWPAIGAPFAASTLRLPGATAQDIADDTVQLLQHCVDEALIADPAGALVPAVASRTLAQRRMITAVEVGDIFDVQRRRRDSLVEARVSEPATW